MPFGHQCVGPQMQMQAMGCGAMPQGAMPQSQMGNIAGATGMQHPMAMFQGAFPAHMGSPYPGGGGVPQVVAPAGAAAPCGAQFAPAYQGFQGFQAMPAGATSMNMFPGGSPVDDLMAKTMQGVSNLSTGQRRA